MQPPFRRCVFHDLGCYFPPVCLCICPIFPEGHWSSGFIWREHFSKLRPETLSVAAQRLSSASWKLNQHLRWLHERQHSMEQLVHNSIFNHVFSLGLERSKCSVHILSRAWLQRGKWMLPWNSALHPSPSSNCVIIFLPCSFCAFFQSSFEYTIFLQKPWDWHQMLVLCPKMNELRT